MLFEYCTHRVDVRIRLAYSVAGITPQHIIVGVTHALCGPGLANAHAWELEGLTGYAIVKLIAYLRELEQLDVAFALSRCDAWPRLACADVPCP